MAELERAVRDCGETGEVVRAAEDDRACARLGQGTATGDHAAEGERLGGVRRNRTRAVEGDRAREAGACGGGVGQLAGQVEGFVAHRLAVEIDLGAERHRRAGRRGTGSSSATELERTAVDGERTREGVGARERQGAFVGLRQAAGRGTVAEHTREGRAEVVGRTDAEAVAVERDAARTREAGDGLARGNLEEADGSADVDRRVGQGGPLARDELAGVDADDRAGDQGGRGGVHDEGASAVEVQRGGRAIVIERTEVQRRVGDIRDDRRTDRGRRAEGQRRRAGRARGVGGQRAVIEDQLAVGDGRNVGTEVEGAVRRDVDGVLQRQRGGQTVVEAKHRAAGIEEGRVVVAVGRGRRGVKRLAEDAGDTEAEGRGPTRALGLRTRAARTVTEADFDVMPAGPVDAGVDRPGAGAREGLPAAVIEDHVTIELHPDGVVDALGEGDRRGRRRDVDLTLVSPGLVRTPRRIGEGGSGRRVGGVDVAHLRAVGDSEEGHRLERGGLIHRAADVSFLQAGDVAVILVLERTSGEVDHVRDSVRAQAAIGRALAAGDDERRVGVDGGEAGLRVAVGEVHGRVAATRGVHEADARGGVRAVGLDLTRDRERAAGRDGQRERLTGVGGGAEGDVAGQGGNAGRVTGRDLRRVGAEEVGDDHGVTHVHSGGRAEGEGDVARAVRVTEAHHIGGRRAIAEAAIGGGRGEDVEHAVLEGHATGEGAAARERPSARTGLDEGGESRARVGERLTHDIRAINVGAAESQAAGGRRGADVPNRRGAVIVEGARTGGLDAGIARTQLEEAVDVEARAEVGQGTATEDEVRRSRPVGAEEAGRTGVAKGIDHQLATAEGDDAGEVARRIGELPHARAGLGQAQEAGTVVGQLASQDIRISQGAARTTEDERGGGGRARPDGAGVGHVQHRTGRTGGFEAAEDANLEELIRTLVGGSDPLQGRAARHGQVRRDVGRLTQAADDAAVGERADLQDAARDIRHPSERAGGGHESPRAGAVLENRGDVRSRAGIGDKRRDGVRRGVRARERKGAGRGCTAPDHGTGAIHDERTAAAVLEGRAEEADREETRGGGSTRADVT